MPITTGLLAPDHGGIFGVGEALTYGSQRLLMSHHSLAREFNRSEISKVHPVNHEHPDDDDSMRLLAGKFADWRFNVDGLVARPTSFSLDELKRMPSRSQITLLACEEGWSFIAEWTGIPLSHVLNLVGASPKAKWVVFHPYDGFWGSIDMPEAGFARKRVPYAPRRSRLLVVASYSKWREVSRHAIADANCPSAT